MKRKTGRVVACALACLMLLAAGCSDASAPASDAPNASAAALGTETSNDVLDPDNPVTLTLWHYYVGDVQQELDAAVAEFNATVGQEQGIVVEPLAMGTIADLEAAVTDSAKGVINSAEMPDIFSCYADKALELDELGVLCDMSAYFTAEEQQQFVPLFLEAGTIGGKLLTLPIVSATEVLYINETALQEFLASDQGSGFSEENLAVWEDLYNLSGAYYRWTDEQTPDIPWDGRGFLGIDELGNYLIASNKQLGVDIIDGADAEVNLDRTVLEKVFGLYYRGMALGYFYRGGRFCSDDVTTGDLAAYVGSSSSATYFPTFVEVNNQESPIELLARTYPVFSGGQPCEMQQGAGMAVAKTDAAKETAATVFLKWFTDVPVNVPFAMQGSYLPVKSAAYDSAEFLDALAALGEGGESARNLGKTYTVALTEVSDGTTYAPGTFSASYDVRSLLRQSLSDAAQEGVAEAAPLKTSGMGADEILASLDVDAKFEAWLTHIKAELDTMGVKYTEV